MKKSYKRLICIIMSLFMLLSALPLTVHAATTVIDVETAEQLTAACEEINNGSGGEYTINLTADIPDGHIDIRKSDAVVTVIGNGHIITASISAVDVSGGATVNLGDGKSTLILTSEDNNDNPGIVHVMDTGSVCNMYAGVTLKDHEGQNYYGGGVTVECGIFHMYGGTIENCGIDGGSVCYGGGVAVAFGGQFIMDGGIITGCYVTSDLQDLYDDNDDPLVLNQDITYVAGGGVIAYCGASFVMNGGSIENCTATSIGNYPAVGGGVAAITSLYSVQQNSNDYGNLDSCIKINTGTISGCTADFGGAIGAGRKKGQLNPIATYTPENSPNPNTPGIDISGGTIRNNTARILGGGLYFHWIRSDFNVSVSNITLTNNNAPEGGAVCIDEKWTNATFTNCTMTQNRATNGKGGAVYINRNVKKQNSITTIDGCTITNNTATDKGAGVYYTVAEDTNDDSVLAIKGANVIQNNTVGNSLNNLYFQGCNHPVVVTGSLAGSQIGITDAKLWEDNLEDTDPTALSFEGLTKDYEEYNSKSTKSEYFTSDHSDWWVSDGGVVYPTTTFYQYEAKQYLTVPKLTKGYPVQERINESGATEYYIILDISPETEWSQFVSDLFPEIKKIFDTEYVFDEDNSEPDNNVCYYYDPNSKNNIVLFASGQYTIRIYLYDNNGQYLAVLQGAGNVQKFAGVDQVNGKMALKLSWYDPDYDPYITDYESTASSTELVEYDSPLTGNKTTYLVNDIGLVSGKQVVDRFTEQEIEKPATPINYSSEVRLVRRNPNYHINNADIANAKYDGEDIFTSYVEAATGKAVKYGETITAFYAVPEVTPTKQNSCPYIFKGWYYDQANDDDSHPVSFGTDKYTKDIYAHWIKVDNVAKDGGDDNILPAGDTEYGGFDLSGVQVREGVKDTNFGYEKKPGGLRFVTSLSTNVVNEINAIKPNNIEYGYVAATNEGWINYHEAGNRKLLYVSKTANGFDTLDPEGDENYSGFANNINCTSRKTNTKGIVIEDHRNFGGYLLYTLVITYENSQESDFDKNVLARPYIRYTDANNLERVAYSEYRGTNVLGGCSTNYNAVNAHQGG